VLVALDVTTRVIAEAATVADTLVVAHHPLLFRPLESLTPDTAAGRVALAAAAAGVAVTAVHTNLDVAVDGAGTSDPIVAALGLRDVTVLAPELADAHLMLVTYVPAPDVERVFDAVTAAGAGLLGAYDRSGFVSPGTGRFRPLPGARPHIGAIGEDERVDEQRLELLVPPASAPAVLAALRASHPYEEVASHLVRTLDGAERGIGRVGDLPAPLSLADVAQRLRDALPAPHLRVAGARDRPVRRVAAVGGAGGSLLAHAVRAGADVLVTADIGHHVALDALELGIALVDAGHHATEVAALPALMERLREDASLRGLIAPVVGSMTPTDPWSDV
jgi:dinuclear metal center YbgI/SA1388 family protein